MSLRLTPNVDIDWGSRVDLHVYAFVTFGAFASDYTAISTTVHVHMRTVLIRKCTQIHVDVFIYTYAHACRSAYMYELIHASICV